MNNLFIINVPSLIEPTKRMSDTVSSLTYKEVRHFAKKWVLVHSLSFTDYVFDHIYLLCQLFLDSHPLSLTTQLFVHFFKKIIQDEFVLPKYSWACVLTLDLALLTRDYSLREKWSISQQLIIANSSTTRGVNLCQTAMSMLGFDLGWGCNWHFN